MANPYKKADSAKKNPPGGKHQHVEVVAIPDSVVAEEPSKVTPAAAASQENPLLGMIEVKEVTRSCSFTLTPEAIKKLDKAAKQLKCSKSKALDTLIKKYL